MSTEAVAVSYYEKLAPEFTFASNFGLAFAVLLNRVKPTLQLLAPCCAEVLHNSPTVDRELMFCHACQAPTPYGLDQLFLSDVSRETRGAVEDWLQGVLSHTHPPLQAHVLAVASAEVVLELAAKTKELTARTSSLTYVEEKEIRSREYGVLAASLSGELFKH